MNASEIAKGCASNRFQDKVVVVNGAAGGMGRALAHRIAREGGKLVLSDLDQAQLETLVQELKLDPAQVAIHAESVVKPSAGESLVQIAMTRFGRIDGFVPFAGIIKFGNVLEAAPEQWDQVLNTNLRGTFFHLQAVGRALVRQNQGGAVVLISSTSSGGPRPNNAEYGVSKAGINHLTGTFALELAAVGARVNAICPGVISTAMWQQVDADRGAILGLPPGELTKTMESEIPMGRVGTPEEVASLIAFLLADDSSYVTGQIITIDGGYKLNHV